MKRNAQESAGKANETHSARVGQAKARLDEAGRALRDEQKIALELPGTHVPAGRTVFLGTGMRVSYGDRALFAGEGADLDDPGTRADRPDRPQRRRQVHPAARDQRRPGAGGR